MLCEFGPPAKKYIFSLLVLIQQIIFSQEETILLVGQQRERGGIHGSALEMKSCIINTMLYGLHRSSLLFCAMKGAIQVVDLRWILTFQFLKLWLQ